MAERDKMMDSADRYACSGSGWHLPRRREQDALGAQVAPATVPPSQLRERLEFLGSPRKTEAARRSLNRGLSVCSQ